jgi:DNA-binding PucR family transcriptional regulator
MPSKSVQNAYDARMAAEWEELAPEVGELIRATARRVLEDPGELFAAMDAAVLEAVPVLAADPAIAADASASNRANLIRWLQANVRDPGGQVPLDLTPEALDIARDVIRRGIDQEALLTAYRQGQNTAFRHWMRVATEETGDAATLGTMLEASSRSMFVFVDDILAGLYARMELEREELVGGRLAQRVQTVNLVLEGAPITEERASARLGYELAREHVALVLWTPEAPVAGQGSLERMADHLAREAGARRPFTMPAGTAVLWAWIAPPDPPSLDAIRLAVDAGPPGVSVAIGTPARGIAGFRRSHEEAIAAQRLAGRGHADQRLVAYGEVEIVVLAAADEARAAQFVTSTLGELVEAKEELRETLRAFLRERGSATRTARVLYTHRNTILNRVARAEALLPRPLSGNELGVAVALEIRHWLP